MADAATKRTIRHEKAAKHPAVAGEPQPLDRLRRGIDRLIDDFQRGYWHFPFSRTVLDIEPFWRGEITWGATPAVDIIENDDGYKVTAELPGMEEKDIEVHFSEGTLTIKGEKEEEKEEKKKNYFLSERRYGAFQRSFRVPDGIDADKIDARFKNGVLSVTLPKMAEAQKKEKKIAVKKA